MNHHTKPRKTPMTPKPEARTSTLAYGIGAAFVVVAMLVLITMQLGQPTPMQLRTPPTAAPQPTTTQAQPTEAQPTPKPAIQPTEVWPTITPFPEMAAPAAPAPAVAQPAAADEPPVIVAVPAVPVEAHEPLRIRAEDECNAEHGR